jgi:hypothetical protein
VTRAREGGARDRSAPRWISGRLNADPTPSASTLVEATPDTNVEGAGPVVVEATRLAPGESVAVVHSTTELEAHTGDDSHVVVDPETGEGELVEREPIEPLVRDGAEPLEGAPPGSPPAPLGGAPEVEVERVDNSSDGGDLGDDELDDDRPVARAGEPGEYVPELVGDDRPATLLELGDTVRPEPDEAWPAGAWVPYGNGKRAHYGPDGWHTGESPGYGSPSS